ncbi:MAG: carboxypeptidase-like regulatory domain-containing protein, partial [Flavobacteriaceae bacterium]
MTKLFLFIFLLPLGLVGQEITITGTVLDEESQQPLPGASVLVKGTTTGAVTDFDGNFEIQTNIGSTLVFSYVGMK